MCGIVEKTSEEVKDDFTRVEKILAWNNPVMMFCIFLAMLLVSFSGAQLTKKFGGASSRYMMAQQHSLAREEGFAEEMMQGQKVVKVFNHEEASRELSKSTN